MLDAIRPLARRIRGMLSPSLRIQETAHAMERSGDLDGALALWAASTQIEPSLRDARLNRVRYKMARKACEDHEWERAANLFIGLKEKTPADAKIRRALFQAATHGARIAQSAGRWQDAIVLWRAVLECAEGSISTPMRNDMMNAAINAARNSEAKGDPQAATDSWKLALQIRPDSQLAKAGIARCAAPVSPAA
ncbi:MAG TPA: hypothetical protein VHL34_23270 [Rhizomicrobium sp.]|nr:hypothetical protein [Rhizomicrobium sp.]